MPDQRDVLSPASQAETASVLHNIEEQLRALVEHSPIIMFALDQEGVFTLSEGRGLVALGWTPGEVVGRSVFDVCRGVTAIEESIRLALAGETVSATVEFRGQTIEARLVPVRDAQGEVLRIIGMADNITDRVRTERELAGTNHILGLISRGVLLETVLDELCRFLEGVLPGARCSILLLDESGRRLLDGAAPSLPHPYRAAIHGEKIGPAAASFGTAIYRGEPVIVADIATDSLWDSHRHLALPHGLRSCWSVPIRTTPDGSLLGALAVYYDETRTPEDWEQYLISKTSSLAGLAIQRRRVEETLQASETRFRTVLQHISDVVCVIEAKGRIRYASPSVEQMLGYHPDTLAGLDAGTLLHPEDQERADAFLAAALEGATRSTPATVRVRHADGEWRHLEVVAMPLREREAPAAVVVTARDITERRLIEDQLARLAFHDGLTGLANRVLFMDRLEHALARAERTAESVSVLFIDLDRFKLINDSLGHAAGDTLLIAVAERLSGCLRASDTLARFGGDEFTVLLERLNRPTDATEVAERIVRALEQPFTLDGHEVFATGSIGVVLGSAESRAIDLLRNADVALYQAKAAGKSRYVLFDERTNGRSMERLTLEADLRRAIERGELQLYYQPEVDLGTGQIVGMEALVRWDHPQRGLVQPDAFIGLAEETGLILSIGEWVLEQACKQARAWQALDSTTGNLLMSVNLSAREFARPDLVERIMAVLGRTELDPARLRLEITESIMVHDSEGAVQTLLALKELGVRLAIDDFGTGYSSLSYLTRFAVDTLKVDRSFVSGVTYDHRTQSVVRAVTAMAHALGMDVTAEGIETGEQLARIRAVQCDWGQGYFFFKPMPAHALTEILRSAQV